jgi:hypothetical protein
MPLLPALAIVFVGISGSDSARVDRQVQALLHKDGGVEPATVTPAELRTLARHGDGCKAIVRRMHVDGVIGGELVESRGGLSLRIVVYGADGAMKDLVETPLGKRALGRDELEVLRSNVLPDVAELRDAAPRHAPAPRGRDDDAGDDGGDGGDHDRAGAHAAPATDEPRDEAAPDDANGDGHDASPIETADASDAITPDEIAASLGSGDAAASGDSDDGDPALHLRASIGFGVAGRSFAGPSTIAGYQSSTVGAIRFDAQIQPTARTTLGVIAERSVGMSTALMDGAATTTISHWQATGTYALTRGPIALGPMLGLGLRGFVIDSKDPARTPDSHYAYLIAGASLSIDLGARVSLAGVAAFEPVVAGAEPTEMAFGDASRWAFELGGAVVVRPRDHVFVRAAAGYQRFSWSWDDAGARGADGAIDSYPSGMMSVGADY